MKLRSLNYFKLIVTLTLLIVATDYIISGFVKLNKYQDYNEINKSSDQIELNKKPKIIKNIKENETSEKLIPKKENILLNKKLVKVKKNDTLIKILNTFFNDNKIKNKIINEIQKEINLNKLSVGQKIFFYTDINNDVKKIKMPINFSTDINIIINSNIISSIREKHIIKKEIKSSQFLIINSLYKDGTKAGLSSGILDEAVRLYSFDIDFQRDIQKNTKFEISFETLFNENSGEISYGKIQYLNIEIQSKNLEYFLFKTDDNFYDYFNREGKNIKKSILKTPINGAQLSSSFGMRKHPILGYNKLHKGVDFAAPQGTPIFAGGNGVIEYAGNNGGYGKYIRIRHNNDYKTAYAHMKAFKKGISKGKRVNQGDVIGYVGTTGKSTGPHLHYEILFQNKQINPMKMKLPSGKILEGNQLNRFKKSLLKIYAKHLFALYE